MRSLFSWILTVAGLAGIGAGAAGYLTRGSDWYHKHWLYLVIGGVALAAVGLYLAREAKVVQHTTMMMQQKQKRNYQIAVRLIALAAAAAAGYFLIGMM